VGDSPGFPLAGHNYSAKFANFLSKLFEREEVRTYTSSSNKKTTTTKHHRIQTINDRGWIFGTQQRNNITTQKNISTVRNNRYQAEQTSSETPSWMSLSSRSAPSPGRTACLSRYTLGQRYKRDWGSVQAQRRNQNANLNDGAAVWRACYFVHTDRSSSEVAETEAVQDYTQSSIALIIIGLFKVNKWKFVVRCGRRREYFELHFLICIFSSGNVCRIYTIVCVCYEFPIVKIPPSLISLSS